MQSINFSGYGEKTMWRDANKRSCLLTFTSILLFLVTLESPFATFVTGKPQDRNVCVKVGDWAKYGDIKVIWNSNDPNAQPDQNLINANATTWINITVTDVSATIITFQNTTALKNGTLITNTAFVDVDSGTGEALTFISAGLNAGEHLYSTEQDILLAINETITRTYSGVVRDVNHLNLTRRFLNQSDLSINVYISLNYYWDKATGVLTERQGTFVNETGSYITSWSRSDKIIETNMWSPLDEAPSTIPPTDNTPWIVGVVAVLIIAIVIFWKRRKKTRFKTSRRRLRLNYARAQYFP